MSTPYTPPPNGFRTFLIVWISQSFSVFGSALTFFAITIYLTQTLYPDPSQKGELAFALSAIALAFALPNVFMAPLAGAWADRADRKRTMMAMDFVNGVLSLVITALVLMGWMNLTYLLILMVLASIVGAFHNAAFDTSYAMLVTEKQLPRANGMMQTIFSLSAVLSPAIAASIISLPALARQGNLPGFISAWLAPLQSGVPLAIIIDAVTFFVASATLIFLNIPSPRRTDLHKADGTKKSLWSDVKEGGLYIWHRRPLLWLLGTFTVANFAGSAMVLQPMLVKFNLAPNWESLGFTLETALALLGTVGSIGGIAGGLLITSWGGLKARRVFGVVVPIMISGVVLIIYGVSPWLYLTAAMAALYDGLIPVMNAHSQTIWQTQTPRELQGRVFSVRRLIAQCSWPLGAALMGALGGLFNPGYVIAGLGMIMALFCFAQLFNPVLLRVEDKAYLDGLAIAAAASESVPGG